MSTKNEPKRVGIWIRVSTEDQVRGESPETHERRARLYAEAKGWVSLPKPSAHLGKLGLRMRMIQGRNDVLFSSWRLTATAKEPKRLPILG